MNTPTSNQLDEIQDPFMLEHLRAMERKLLGASLVGTIGLIAGTGSEGTAETIKKACAAGLKLAEMIEAEKAKPKLHIRYIQRVGDDKARLCALFPAHVPDHLVRQLWGSWGWPVKEETKGSATAFEPHIYRSARHVLISQYFENRPAFPATKSSEEIL